VIAEISALVDAAVAEGVFPAAQVAIRAGGRALYDSAHGGLGPARADLSTLFDVASLTKVVATTTLVYRMVSAGQLSLDDAVGRFFPGASCREATVRHLLAHRSGLPAWRPLFATARAREEVVAAALHTPRQAAPGGDRRYSDIGFIVLGAILEKAAGERLDALFSREVAAPLGLVRTSFRPLPAARDPVDGDRLAVAPTGDRRPRRPAPGQEESYEPGPEVQDAGEVDDDNAWAMGGVAAHAGLFSTAAEVASWADAIREELEGAGRLGRAEVLMEMAAQGLGFDRPGETGSSAGRVLGRLGPRGAIGHLGFTGCSVWIDLDRGVAAVLLSNRVFPDRKNEGIRAFRPLFHDRVMECLEKMETR